MNKQLLIDFAVAMVCYIAIIIGCYIVFTDDVEADTEVAYGSVAWR